ncbi:MAG TPA: hypothetical protein VLN49_06040 [Gemmatimonadaceae bacterium]|nr:hypothetical protein [Gemmatimonadaceae bacterium]
MMGCLVSLLCIAAVGYFSMNTAEVYWRYYQFRDDIQQEVRFSQRSRTDSITLRLRAAADSLGLPEAAGHVLIRRYDNRITIESDYYERVEVPGYVREIHFHPRAEGRF